MGRLRIDGADLMLTCLTPTHSSLNGMVLNPGQELLHRKRPGHCRCPESDVQYHIGYISCAAMHPLLVPGEVR